MEVVVRVVIGLLLFPLIYWLASLIFGLVTGIVNVIAYATARGVRRIFGIDGTWINGTAVALGIGSITKTLSSFLLGLSIFVFAAIPPGDRVAGWMLTAAWGLALAVWMPSLFVGALCSRADDFAAISAEIDGESRY